MNKNEHLREAYLAGHKTCGLKVGDKVKVTRSAESYEQGWGRVWVDSMDDYVHAVVEITDDNNHDGFRIVFGHRKANMPWFILEKIECPKTEDIFLDDLDFGCQQSHVKTLVGRIKEYIDNKLEDEDEDNN